MVSKVATILYPSFESTSSPRRISHTMSESMTSHIAHVWTSQNALSGFGKGREMDIMQTS